MSDWHLGLRTLCGRPPVRFYEKILVLDGAEDVEIRGLHGWMLGVSADEQLIYSYHVFFDGIDSGYTLLPEEVEGTGEVASRARFYDDSVVIRVQVDEHGRGSIVD